jgi:mycofactocin system FadH/OYE family oxidoreductase 1
VGVQLLEPLALGALRLTSRVVFGPHETNLADGRRFSERHAAYYRRRAQGGVGMIVTETASVHPSDWPYERAPLAATCGEGWKAIVEACGDTPVVASLGHAGGQGSSAYSQAPLWAPSRVPEVNTREVPKWMEPEDIAAVIDGFAAAARVALDAGCAGVEIDAGAISLVRQFLSGLTNHRGDEWGEDRTRFAREVIGAVRAAVGEAVVGLRLSADELAPWAGITPEMAVELAPGLCEQVDYLTVVRGSIYSAQAARPDTHTPTGFNLDLAGTLRAAVGVPVIAQGSIVEVDQANWAVGEGGRADAVEMTRALLADADLVSKLRAGATERIRPCILCNQTCQVRDARNPIVTCVVDPRTGHETEDPDETDQLPAMARPVTVVGGGPAGLEAARVAALRGHRVRLVERSDRVGGQINLAARAAGRERLARIVEWLHSECRSLGVDICPGTEWEPGVDGPVIWATGARDGWRDYRVTPAATVVSAREALEDLDAVPAGAVFVWDPIGGPIGVSVAETLVAAGRQVTVATPDHIVGNELSRTGDLAPANARLQQAGVNLERRTLLRVVRKGSVEVEDRFSGARRTIRAAVVVDAGHRLPDDQPVPPGALRAGDCVAPRTIHEAILEGRRAALALDGVGWVSDGVPMGTPH